MPCLTSRGFKEKEIMKEQGMFFTDEQKELLKEIDKLERYEDNQSVFEKYLKQSGIPERVFIDERKSLSVVKRMQIADSIIEKYSMLKKHKGILHEQIFSAMEEYLKACTEKGHNLKGL